MEIQTAFVAFAGVLAGGLCTWFAAKHTAQKNWEAALASIKTEHMAEKTAQYFLSHKGYTDRSFNLLRERIGGFEDDELRRILVRAGAIRYMRGDGSEWWRLVRREHEAIQHILNNKGRLDTSPIDDLIDDEPINTTPSHPQ